jgi:hypothetical protein
MIRSTLKKLTSKPASAPVPKPEPVADDPPVSASAVFAASAGAVVPVPDPDPPASIPAPPAVMDDARGPAADLARVREQIAQAEKHVAAMKLAHEEALLTAVMALPTNGDEAEHALALAKSALDNAEGRVKALAEAIAVAERAVQRHENAAARMEAVSRREEIAALIVKRRDTANRVDELARALYADFAVFADASRRLKEITPQILHSGGAMITDTEGVGALKLTLQCVGFRGMAQWFGDQRAIPTFVDRTAAANQYVADVIAKQS